MFFEGERGLRGQRKGQEGLPFQFSSASELNRDSTEVT